MEKLFGSIISNNFSSGGYCGLGTSSYSSSYGSGFGSRLIGSLLGGSYGSYGAGYGYGCGYGSGISFFNKKGGVNYGAVAGTMLGMLGTGVLTGGIALGVKALINGIKSNKTGNTASKNKVKTQTPAEQTEIEKIKEEISTKNEAIKANDKTIKDHTASINKLTENRTQKDEQIKKNNLTIVDLENDKRGIQNQIATLQGQLSSAEELNKANIQNQISQLEAKDKAIDDKIAKINEENEGLQQEISTYNAEIKLKNQSIEELNSNNETLQGEISDLKEIQSELEQQEKNVKTLRRGSVPSLLANNDIDVILNNDGKYQLTDFGNDIDATDIMGLVTKYTNAKGEEKLKYAQAIVDNEALIKANGTKTHIQIIELAKKDLQSKKENKKEEA